MYSGFGLNGLAVASFDVCVFFPINVPLTIFLQILPKKKDKNKEKIAMYTFLEITIGQVGLADWSNELVDW